MTVVTCRCGRRFEAAAELAGKQVACPACGGAIRVPGAAAAGPVVTCPCGQSFRAQAALAGSTIPCPSCGNPLRIGASPAARAAAAARQRTAPRSTPVPTAAAPARTLGHGQPLAPTKMPARATRHPQWSFPLGWVVGVGVGAVVLVLLLIVGSIVWRRVAPALTSFVNRGNPAQYFGPEIPLTPQALEEYYRLPDGVEDTTALWLAAVEQLNTTAYVSETAGIPIVKNNPGVVPKSGITWPAEPQAVRLLEKYRGSLQQLYAAAEKGGAVRYPTRFADAWAMEMDEEAKIVEAGRLLHLDARVSARQGDASGTARALRTLSRLARSFDGYPNIVAQTAYVRFSETFLLTVADLLPDVEFSDGDLAMLSRELEQVDLDRSMYCSLIGELVNGLLAFDDEEMLGILYDRLSGRSLMDERSKQARALVDTLKSRSSAAALKDKEDYLRKTQTILAVAREPFPQKWESAKKFPDVAEPLDPSRKSPPVESLITSLLQSRPRTAFQDYANFTASFNNAIAAIAVERFRRGRGQLPSELAALIPDYLTQIPQDPFDGKPLRYRVESDHYLVYSVGANGVDDGGKQSDDADVVVKIRLRSSGESTSLARPSEPKMPAVPSAGPSGTPTPQVASTGLASLTEQQRKILYMRARLTIVSHERLMENSEKLHATLIEGRSGEFVDREIARYEASRRKMIEYFEQQMNNLCAEYAITRDELQAVLREGEAAGWK